MSISNTLPKPLRRMSSRSALVTLTVLATTAWTPAAISAEFPAAIALSSLNGTNGFRLDGATARDASGYSVASAGDVNGDGFADLIIGAPGTGPAGTESGSSYVVFGKASGFTNPLALSSLDGTNGFRLDGVYAADSSGYSVASAGDVNGDGFADLIIGAYQAEPNGSYSGSSYVVFGGASGFGASFDLSSLNGSNGFRLDGVSPGDRSGFSLAGAGDVNGDGFADVIVGARGADPNGVATGSSYVVFGGASGFGAAISLSSLDGSNGFRLDGAAFGDTSGISVASAGDVNGDGFSDLIVGAPGTGPYGTNSGSSYVVFGKGPSSGSFAATLNLSTLDGSNGFRLDGAPDEESGYSVASAGDVNGDGFSDVIVGAPGGGFYGTGSGSSSVVFGKGSKFPGQFNLSRLNGANGFRLDGVAGVIQTGLSVSGAGDVNGDGFADVIVATKYAQPHGTHSGSSYVVFGRTPDGPRTRAGSAAGQYISGGNFADTLAARGGNDALEGRRGADALDGGAGSDTATYAHAPAAVIASLAAPAFNTGHAAGDIYTLIENLEGSGFADTLRGNGRANIITGGKGRDRLTGNGGADAFRFVTTSDSGKGLNRDIITDFETGTASTSIDRIDLRAIDANTKLGGNQNFTFIGTGVFQLNQPGRLRAVVSGPNTIIAGEVNGDAKADFEVELSDFTAIATLTAADFIR